MTARSDSAVLRPRVMILADYYLPGFRAGGPVKSVRNLVAALDGAFDFRIATRDRDLGDAAPYDGVRTGAWTEDSGVPTLYLPPDTGGLRRLADALREEPYDVLYLNSLFSPRFSIWPLLLRRFGRISPPAVVVAPRGELSPGAIRLKAVRKRTYLAAAKLLGLHRGVLWQASSPEEERDIRQWMGAGARIRLGPNVPVHADAESRSPKPDNRLKLLFVSRISRKKNLDGALRILRRVRVPVEFTIVGPREDARYWAVCEALEHELPPSIDVNHRGPVPPDRIMEVYREHDLMFLPTLGENYGWVIAESLAAGCPVLISDQTPWRGLQAEGVGWDLPLEDEAGFVRVLEDVYHMDADEHTRLAQRAAAWIREATGTGTAARAQSAIFEEAARTAGRPVVGPGPAGLPSEGVTR